MTRAMSITTKRGDKGFTDLLFGGKASKGDPQIEALGAVDELNANLGIARVLVDGEVARAIDQIQEWLVTLMGELAMPMGKEIEYEKSGFGRISTIEIEWLEDWSASIEKEEKFKGRLRPGERGGEVSADHLPRPGLRGAHRPANGRFRRPVLGGRGRCGAVTPALRVLGARARRGPARPQSR